MATAGHLIIRAERDGQFPLIYHCAHVNKQSEPLSQNLMEHQGVAYLEQSMVQLSERAGIRSFNFVYVPLMCGSNVHPGLATPTALHGM